eukprot:scaffold1273_cov258-Chaetoceros_neogracile.AAC.2
MEDALSTASLLVIAVLSIIFINIFLKLATGSGFTRDEVKNPFSDSIIGGTSLLNNKDSVLSRDGVMDSINEYEKLFNGARQEVGSTTTKESISMREKEYKTMVNSFYDLVTDFYEWGWGQSFHFAPRRVGETFEESVLRAEYYLALRTGMDASKKVLDVGCGVGGPARNLAIFTGADITGVTINDYQVRVGNKYNALKGLHKSCRFVQGDFQNLTEYVEKGKFDIAYEIEATCHSPDRRICLSGVNDCLKKGGLFVGYEWTVLPECGYDKTNMDHVRIKEGIEVGNGLPTLATPKEIIQALEDSGFEVLDSFDANRNGHSLHEIPWYQTLKGSLSLKGFRMTHFGRLCTHALISVFEFVRIAPKGSVRVSALLNATALDIVEAGEKELFTPSFFFLARKK